MTAYAWLNIITCQFKYESPPCKEFKDIVAKEMTPEQITEAEALAKQMIKKNPKLINK